MGADDTGVARDAGAAWLVLPRNCHTGPRQPTLAPHAGRMRTRFLIVVCAVLTPLSAGAADRRTADMLAQRCAAGMS